MARQLAEGNGCVSDVCGHNRRLTVLFNRMDNLFNLMGLSYRFSL